MCKHVLLTSWRGGGSVGGIVLLSQREASNSRTEIVDLYTGPFSWRGYGSVGGIVLLSPREASNSITTKIFDL